MVIIVTIVNVIVTNYNSINKYTYIVGRQKWL